MYKSGEFLGLNLPECLSRSYEVFRVGCLFTGQSVSVTGITGNRNHTRIPANIMYSVLATGLISGFPKAKGKWPESLELRKCPEVNGQRGGAKEISGLLVVDCEVTGVKC
ncbi:hypothetical protein BaRGS_00030667 [Batillaria attramentaria]|uniref:Uncharacterized protein n=1 Tax=Batillaria attramentaria TaxID=370345 RepID=A0ABD0JSZ4_9CAEN